MPSLTGVLRGDVYTGYTKSELAIDVTAGYVIEEVEMALVMVLTGPVEMVLLETG